LPLSSNPTGSAFVKKAPIGRFFHSVVTGGQQTESETREVSAAFGTAEKSVRGGSADSPQDQGLAHLRAGYPGVDFAAIGP
jgi:hypothetical protein